MGRRLYAKDYGILDDPEAFIELPDEWLVRHALIRDKAVKATAAYENIEITNLTIALSIIDGKNNLPGFEGDSPLDWDLENAPLRLVAWLTDFVITDFNRSFIVSKKSLPRSAIGQPESMTAAKNEI